MKRFTFDMRLNATITVAAPDEDTARDWLADALDCADTNFGAYPTGDPILGEASIAPNMPLALVGVYEDEPEATTDSVEEDAYCAHIPHRIKLTHPVGSAPAASMLTRAAFQEDDGEID